MHSVKGYLLMTYQGKVQGGVIVLTGGLSLPDGTEVTVVPRQTEPLAEPCEQVDSWERMAALARWAETQPCDLPEDLASNHDHYLHGLPTRP